MRRLHDWFIRVVLRRPPRPPPVAPPCHRRTVDVDHALADAEAAERALVDVRIEVAQVMREIDVELTLMQRER